MKINFKKLILPASLFVAAQSHALGLGNLQINSALDETLKADIPLMLGEGETVEDLSVYLASSEDYKKVGLDKSYVPSNIQLEVVEDNNNKRIKLSSIGSVTEPIVSLLLVVDWKNGHLLREYTLLLDPPVFGVDSSQISTSRPVQTQTYIPESVDEEISNESSNEVSAPVQATSTQSTTIDNSSFVTNNQAQTVVVESGDTLWRIASRYADSTINPQQMMVAIFDENPTAFANNDMNRLKKGVELIIPSTEIASAISFQQAFSEVKAQVEQYKQVTDDYSIAGTDSSSDVDYGIEIVPPKSNDSTSSDDSSSNNGANALSSTENTAELNRAKEELVNASLEKQELSNRVNDLEQIVKDQEVALQIKDDNLAQLEQQVGEQSLGETISNPDTTEVDVTAVDDSNDDDLSDVDESALEDDVSLTSNSEESQSEEAEDAVWGGETEETTGDLASFEDGSEDGDSSPETMDSNSDSEELASQEDNQDTTQEDVAPAQMPARSMTFMDKVMKYKTEGMIGLGALLAIFGFLFFRNRKTETVDDGGSFLDSINNDKETADEELSDVIAEIDDTIESLDDTTEEMPTVEVMNDIDDEVGELDEIIQGTEEVVELISEDSEDDIDLESDSTEDFDIDLTTGDSEEESFDIFEEDSLELDLDVDETSADTDDENEGFDLDEELDIELDDLIDSNEETEAQNIDSTETELDLDKDEFDSLLEDTDDEFNLDDVSLDFDDTVEEINLETNDSVEEIDLDIDLDLEDSDFEELDSDLGSLDSDSEELDINIESDKNENNQVENDEDIDIGLDLGLDDFVSDDAVDTKLDLAKAYFEMGDIDGAMQMVTEIFEEGSEEQQTKAQELKDEMEKS